MPIRPTEVAAFDRVRATTARPVASAVPVASMPVASLLAASAFAAAPASAALVEITSDRDLFEASLEAAVVEDCEDEDLGVLAGPFTLAGSGLSVGLDGAGWDLAITDSSTFSYNTTDGGAQHLRSAFGSGSWTLVLETPVAVTAFGFSITGFQDLTGLGGLEVELWSDGTEVASFLSADDGGFFEQFHGFWSDTAFDEVRITVSGNDIAGIDDVAFAVIPAPSAVPVLAGVAGLVLAGGRRRRA